ncbi:MAG: glycosyltransferase family 4 protein [Elusimicrobiota bacterium]
MNTTTTGLRICMLTARFYPHLGGTEQQAWYLSEKLIENGYTAFIVTQRYPGTLPKTESIGKVKVIRLSTLWDGYKGSFIFVWTTFWWLLMHANEYDIIHAHLASSHAVVALKIGWLLRKPVVIKFAGARATGDIGTSKKVPWGGLKLSFLRIFGNRFVCPSMEVKDEMVLNGFNSDNIAVIPNGVDTKKFAPADEGQKKKLRVTLGLPAEDKLFIYTGRLQPGKGLEFMVKTWKNVLIKDSTAKLLIVGDGVLIDELKNLADECGITNNVIFTGRVNDVPDYLRAADVFVTASKGEGMSNALLEALSCGIPAVVTDIPANTVLVKNRVNGLVYSIDDTEMFVNIVNRLMSEAGLSQKLGTAAHESVLAKYSVDTVTQQYIQYYKKLVNKQ